MLLILAQLACRDPKEHTGDPGHDLDSADAGDSVDTTDSQPCQLSTWYADSDGDGYGDEGASAEACEQPPGSVVDHTDCDDILPSVHPGADEYCNAIDDDCDGETDEDAVDAATWYTDADGDGYGDASTSSSSCTAGEGQVADATDCDDSVKAPQYALLGARGQVDHDRQRPEFAAFVRRGHPAPWPFAIAIVLTPSSASLTPEVTCAG